MKESVQEASAAHVKISGRVQGVGFRYFVYRHALKNDITGWVRNREDGSVEARFEGPKEKVEDIIDLCRKGPVGSSVRNVEVEEREPEGKYEGFRFRYQ
ncbi:MAG: acylphosphatase [Balneolia bacterium]|nr:acylphosphatase [Balneolia bacterium]